MHQLLCYKVQSYLVTSALNSLFCYLYTFTVVNTFCIPTLQSVISPWARVWYRASWHRDLQVVVVKQGDNEAVPFGAGQEEVVEVVVVAQWWWCYVGRRSLTLGRGVTGAAMWD